MIKDLLKFATFFRMDVSEDALNAKVVFEDHRTISSFNYNVTISAFSRGIIVYLRINDFQQVLEITENVEIPIKVPTPLGFIGGLVSVQNLRVQVENMSAHFKVDMSMGFVGNINLIDEKIEYENVSNQNNLGQGIIGDNIVLVIIGLIKADKKIQKEELVHLHQFMESIGMSSEKQNYFRGLLSSELLLNPDFNLLKKSGMASVLIDLLIAVSKGDGDIDNSELFYILDACEKLGEEIDKPVSELNGNFMSLKYNLKDAAIQNNDVIVVNLNGGNKAQFYKNNRVFIFDGSNQIKAKASYSSGGRIISFDDGSRKVSKDIISNLIF